MVKITSRFTEKTVQGKKRRFVFVTIQTKKRKISKQYRFRGGIRGDRQLVTRLGGKSSGFNAWANGRWSE